MVIFLEQGADLHMAQLIPLPLTVSCFSKIQIGYTFLVPAHPGSPGKRAVKRVCVCVCVCPSSKVPKYRLETFQLHGSGGLLTMVAKLTTIASNNIIALTSLCSAAPLGCKHGTGCVCC